MLITSSKSPKLTVPSIPVAGIAGRPASGLTQALGALDDVKDGFQRSPQTSDTLGQAFDAIPTPKIDAKARLLSDNFEAWNQRWKLLESADYAINTTAYTWDNDVFGRALLGHVFLKAREGVHTRIMVDAVGDPVGKRGMKAKWGGQDYLQELVALPNAQAKVYHPHYKKPLNALLHPTKTDGIAANHDKILEVDGDQAITGGRNIGHHYFIHPSDDPKAWRDTDVHLTGWDAAHELRDAFEEEFDLKYLNHTVKPDLLGNWKKRDIELLGAYSMMDSWLKGTGSASTAEDLVAGAVARLPYLGIDREPNKRELQALKESADELVHQQALRGSYHQASSAEHDVKMKVIDRTSAVGSGLDEMNASLLALAKGATSEIDIQNPYFVLTDPMLDALSEASDRGVKIRIATNTPSSSDSAFTQVFFLNDWDKVLAEVPNLEIYGATGERKHHGKVAVIDDRISVVGTYNLDLISSVTNSEVAAVIDSPGFARDAKASIEDDYADPTVAYQQYKILENDQGEAVDIQGRLVTDSAHNLLRDPVAVFGPEDHLTPEQIRPYDKKIKKYNWMREHLPQLKSLRRNVRGADSFKSNQKQS